MTTTVAHSQALPRQGVGRGLGWALLSAASFALSGPLAKSLLEIGWSPGAVVLVRIGGAFVALVIPCLFLLRRIGLPTSAQTRRMLVYGVVAVALAQLCYFSAVQYLPVSVALLLEYLAPVLLIGYSWLRSRRRPALPVFVGAAVAMAGMVLVLDIVHGFSLNPIGVLYGLGAAVCLSVYFVLSDDSSSQASIPALLMTTVGAAVGSLVLLAAGAAGVIPMVFGFHDTALAGVRVSWLVPILLLILVTASLAYLTGIVAVRLLGSAVASFVALSEVLFAVTFAAILLSQQITLLQGVGGALVLTGIATVQRRAH